MTESRKQFEKWCESIGLNKIAWHPYSDDIGETAWQAWQASRAAIVIELPPQHEVVYDGYDGAELRYALKQIGVNYE